MEKEFCPRCGSPTREVPAGVSKRTQKPYNAFMSCSSRSCDWTGRIDSKPSNGGAKKEEDQGQRIIDGLLKIYKRLDDIELKIDCLLPEPKDDGESFK